MLTSRFAAVLAAILSLPLVTAAQVSVIPTDIQMPGTQPDELVNALDPPTTCNMCHGFYDLAVEPSRNWMGSMMAQAGRDPVFWAATAVAEQDFAGSADLCIRCHAPNGWTGGRSTPTDGSALIADDLVGVNCAFCHRLVDSSENEFDGEQTAPFLAHDDSVPPKGYHGSAQYVLSTFWFPEFGPYADPATPHGFEQASFVRSADMCATCHDVSNPLVGDLAPNNGAQVPLAPGTFSGVPGSPVEGKAAFNNFPYQYGAVERTSSEHFASGLSQTPMSQFNDLPKELRQGALRKAYEAAVIADENGNYADGTLRTYSCQSCHLPPVTGQGCNLGGGVPVREDLPLHDLTGANAFVPQIIKWLDTDGPGLVVGGGLLPYELDALDAGTERALATLESAATLLVVGNSVKIVNHTGHKLPTGYPEGRRMWLRVTWEDADGNVIGIDGGDEEIVVDIDGSPTAITTLDVEGNDTKIYAIHKGISQEWANELLAMGVPAGLPLMFDRLTGAVETTLGDAAGAPPRTVTESLHFVLNDEIISDNRIPPYRYSHDKALARSALPVPANQYGDPGPGGNYDHKDFVPLDPPVGAAHALVQLMYEPVSWEYASFLSWANDGSVGFLSDAGDRMLDGWLNTPSDRVFEMASADWFEPWFDLGSALAGTNGDPVLTGTGTLVPGSPVSLDLTNALAGSIGYLVVGTEAIDLDFFGGTLVPAFAPPGGTFISLPVDLTGGIDVSGSVPSGLPSGLNLYVQYWIEDGVAPLGLAASNALAGTVP